MNVYPNNKCYCMREIISITALDPDFGMLLIHKHRDGTGTKTNLLCMKYYSREKTALKCSDGIMLDKRKNCIPSQNIQITKMETSSIRYFMRSSFLVFTLSSFVVIESVIFHPPS